MSFAGTDIINRSMLDMEESRMYDVGAERGFLACIVKRPELIHEAAQRVPRHALFAEIHGYIYGAMLFVREKVVARGWDLSFDPIAMATIAREMGAVYEQRFYRQTDGLEKIRELERLSIGIDINQFGNYVATILDRCTRVQAYRQARVMQERLMSIASNPDASVPILETESRLCQMTYAIDDHSRIAPLASQEQESLAKAYVARNNPNLNLFYIPVNRFPKWMRYLGGGFWRRNLTILAARPKTGKSTLLAQLVSEVSTQFGYPTLFMDNEMTREEIWSRELSLCSGWAEQDILAGKMFAEGGNTNCSNDIANVLAAMRNRPIYYVNVAGKPVSFIVSVLRQFRQIVGYQTFDVFGRKLEVSNPSLVVYDWLKIPSGSNLGRNQQAYQALGEQASAIKDSAAKLDLAIVAGAQHNREAGKMKPKDWLTQADSATGGSDELNKFCTVRCDLRNLNSDELAAVDARWPNHPSRQGCDGNSGHLVNQMLYLPINRKGPECKHGIPMFHNKGKFRYEEPVDMQPDANGTMVDAVDSFFAAMIAEAKTKGVGKPPTVSAPAASGGVM